MSAELTAPPELIAAAGGLEVAAGEVALGPGFEGMTSTAVERVSASHVAVTQKIARRLKMSLLACLGVVMSEKRKNERRWAFCPAQLDDFTTK